MNEKAAIDAIYTVIDAAKATLVTGFTHSGVARGIKHLAKTTLAAPVEYYAVAVDCTGCREFSMPAKNNLTGVAWAEYDIAIQLADVANIQSADTSPYETVHGDFRKLRDRVIRLIRDSNTWFPSESSSPRFRLPIDASGVDDRRINAENQNFSFRDMEDIEYAMLFSKLTFTLVDYCADSSLLYS